MTGQDLQILFEQAVASFEAAGIPVDDTMRADFEPLLRGEMTPQEHREFLQRKYGR